MYSRLFSSPECLIQRVQGIPTTVLLPGFSVAAVRLVLEFLAVGEVTMATHQWEEVDRLLIVLELSTGQVQLETCTNKNVHVPKMQHNTYIIFNLIHLIYSIFS